MPNCHYSFDSDIVREIRYVYISQSLSDKDLISCLSYLVQVKQVNHSHDSVMSQGTSLLNFCMFTYLMKVCWARFVLTNCYIHCIISCLFEDPSALSRHNCVMTPWLCSPWQTWNKVIFKQSMCLHRHFHIPNVVNLTLSVRHSWTATIFLGWVLITTLIFVDCHLMQSAKQRMNWWHFLIKFLLRCEKFKTMIHAPQRPIMYLIPLKI